MKPYMVKAKHEDFLGQPIEIGDYVLGSAQGGAMTPELFQIKRFTRLKVRLVRIGWGNETIRTAADLVKIDAQLITMFKLKQTGKK